MRLDDGQTIAARITAESLDLLDLSVGLEVLALFKATAVKIHTGQANATSGNRLAGRVARRSTARPGAQMSLELGAGLRLAGFGNDHATLRLRTPAFATFDESAVIIARIA